MGGGKWPLPGSGAARLAADMRGLGEAIGSVGVPMNPQADYRKMVKECLANDDDVLSDREQDFLDSLNKWTGDYTERQVEWLERIWSKCFS